MRAHAVQGVQDSQEGTAKDPEQASIQIELPTSSHQFINVIFTAMDI
jgi:hypothetical protein